MASKDYNLPFQNLNSLYPNELKNPMNESLFDNLFNRFMTRDESVPLYGYVGKKPVTDSGAPAVPQLDSERTVNSLIPVFTFKVGSETHTFTVQDLVRKAQVLGLSSDQSSWLYSQGNNYSPPIDLDKFTNFFNYYWVAKAGSEQVDLKWNRDLAPEYYVIARPKPADLDKLNVRVATTEKIVLTGTGFYPQTWTVLFDTPTTGTITANGALGSYVPVTQNFSLTSNDDLIQFTVSDGGAPVTLLSFHIVRDSIFDENGDLVGTETFATGDQFVINAQFLSTVVSVTFTGSSGVKGKLNRINTLNTYQTIDGVKLKEGDRVLVKNNSVIDNGIYVVGPHNWTRAVDFNGTTEQPGAVTFVTSGTVNGGKQFVSVGSTGNWSWTHNGRTYSNTNDWQQGNFWLSNDEVISGGYDLSKVVQATRPIIEVHANVELNNHVDSSGLPASTTGIFYGQSKYDFDQVPLFNLYRYDGTPAKVASSLFFYVESPTAKVDGQLQRRVKLTPNSSADFIFDHGMIDADGQLLFYRESGELKTIWHPGYKQAEVTEQVFHGNGNGVLTVSVVDPTQVQQIWTLTATSATTFSVVGSKTAQLPAPYNILGVGTSYNNGLFSAQITAGAVPFSVGDVFTFAIGGEETVRYAYASENGALVDVFGGPAADTNGVGAWLIPRMFYNNVAANNSNEIPEGTMYSHFRGILANQLKGGTEDRAFGGSIKLWSEQQNLLASLLMQRDLTPLSMIDGARRQYEVALNSIVDLFFTSYIKYLGETEVIASQNSLNRYLDKLLEERAKDRDAKQVLFDTTSAVVGFPPTAPQLGISPRMEPGIVFDDELGITLFRHHDGHLSPLFTDSLDFRDQLISPSLMVKRADGTSTHAVGSYTTTPPSLPYKGMVWIYPLGFGQVEYRVFDVVSDLSAPISPVLGDYWYSRPTNTLYSWDGIQWVVQANQLAPWKTVSFADTLNQLLLVLEQRLYDGCPPTHRTYFTNGDVTGAPPSELMPALKRELAQWAAINGYDPTAPDYVSTDPFTWNYGSLTTAQVAPISGSVVPPRWFNLIQAHQATVAGVIPTARPNIEPWKLMGFTEEPASWSSTWSSAVTPEDIANPINGFNNAGTVRAVSVANSPTSGVYAIDGVNLVSGDSVLLTAQTNAVDNGVWVVSAGAWTRASIPLTMHSFFTVSAGYEYSGTLWYLTASVANVGTDPVALEQARYWKLSMWAMIQAAHPTLKLSIDVTRDALIPPYVSTVVSSFSNAITNVLPPNPTASYEFGEGSPVETIWKRSSEYRYALAKALFITDPLTWIRSMWGYEWVSVDGIQYDGFDLSMPGHRRFKLHGEKVSQVQRTKPLTVGSISAPGDFAISIVHDAYSATNKQVFSVYSGTIYLGAAEEGITTTISSNGFIIANLKIEDEGRPFRVGDMFTISGPADGSTVSLVFTPTDYFKFMGFGQVFTQALRAFEVDTNSGYAIAAYREWDVNLGYRAGGLVETNDLRVFTDSEALPESAYELRVKRSPYAADTWAQALRVSVVQLGSHTLSPTGAPVASNDASDWVFRIDGYNSRHLDIEYFTFGPADKVTFKALSSAHTDRTWYQPTVITGSVKTQLPITVTGLQNLIDIIFGYTAKLAKDGWVFNESSTNNIDQETGRNRTWQLEIEKMVDRVYAGIQLNEGVIMNPFMDRIWIERDQGLLSPFVNTSLFDVDSDAAVYDTLGVKINVQDLVIMRRGGRAEIWANVPMFGVHAQFDEYEHIFVLANQANPSTGEGLIYDPFTGARIITLRFNGRKQATNTLRPEYGGHYLVGNQVKRNLQSSTDMVQGFYDATKVFEDETSTRHALALLGFTPKDYMSDLDLTNRTQFDFWRGLIQLKGTNSSVQAFLNNDRFQDAKIDEYWAYKVAEYGDARPKIYPELKVNVNDCVQQFTKLVFDQSPAGDFAAFTQVNADDESRWFSIDDLNGATTFEAAPTGTLSQYIDEPYLLENNIWLPFQLKLPFVADWLTWDTSLNIEKINDTTFLVNDLSMAGDTQIEIKGYGVSVGKFNPMKLFNYIENEKIDDISFWHPAAGQHTPNAIEAVNIIADQDPARYNVSTLVDGNVNYDPLRPWGAKEVGRVWWNTKKLDYVPYYDKVIFPRVEDRLARWGTLADYGTIEVYEWVESTVPPSQYADQVTIDAGDADISSSNKADGVVADAKYYVRDRVWLQRPIAWSYSPVPNQAAHVGGSFFGDFNAALTVEQGTSNIGDGVMWLSSNTFYERGITSGMHVGAWNLDPLNPTPLSELIVLDDFTKRVVTEVDGLATLFTEVDFTTATSSAPVTVSVKVDTYTTRIGQLGFFAEPVKATRLVDAGGDLTNIVDVTTSIRVVELENNEEDNFEIVTLRTDRGNFPFTLPTYDTFFTTYAGELLTVRVGTFGLVITVKFNQAGTWSTVTLLEAIVGALGSRLIFKDQVSYQAVVLGSNLPETLDNDQDPQSGSYNGIGWRVWTVPTQQQLDADSRYPNSCWVPFVGDWPTGQVAFNASIDVIQRASFAYQLNDRQVIRPITSTWTPWRVLEDVAYHQVVTPYMTEVVFEIKEAVSLSSISLYVNGVAQLAGTYTLSGNVVTLVTVPPVGAEVHLIVRGYVPTIEELAFNPDVADDAMIQQQYKVDYQHVEVPVRDENGSIITTKYYFWVKDRSSIAQNKKLSVKAVSEMLKVGPANYVTFQDSKHLQDNRPNADYAYNAIAVAGLNYVVAKDGTYKIRFTRDFTLRDDPQGMDLKNVHTEWTLLRPGQRARIPETLWNLLTNTVSGIDAAGNSVPSARRLAYDERNGTTTRYGFGADQALAPRELVIETLRFTVLNTRLIDDSGPVPLPDYISFLDFNESDKWFETPEKARSTMIRIWNEAKPSQVNELFFAAVEDICAANFTMTDLFKTSRLSVYSIKVVDPVPVEPSYE